MTINDLLLLVPVFVALFWLGYQHGDVTNLKKEMTGVKTKQQLLAEKVNMLELIRVELSEIKTNIQWVIKTQQDIIEYNQEQQAKINKIIENYE